MKIVIVKQKDLKDCGCCCLQSIIKFYHGFVPLEKIRRDTCTDSGGTTAYHLIESAKKYGFEACGKRISFENLEKQLLPLIAHVVYPNGYAHYIVIYKIKKGILTIMDPAQGKILLNVNEFKEIWSNVVIIFHPKNKIIKISKNTSIFSIFLGYIYLFKNKYIIYILINIILMILTLVHSLFLSWSFDNLGNLDKYFKLIVTFLIVIFVKNIVNYIRGKILYNLNYSMDRVLYNDFNYHLFNLPSNFLLNRTSGEVMSRIDELNNIKSLLNEIFITLFLDSILIIVSLILLGFMNLTITLLYLVVITIYSLIHIFSSRFIYNNIKDVIEKDSLYNNCLLENINLYNSIKNLNLTEKILQKTANKLDDLCKSNLKFNNSYNLFTVIENLFNDLVLFFIIVLCVYNIFYSVFDISKAILFISLASVGLESIKNIIDIIPRLNYFKASFEKIDEFYNIKIENDEAINTNFKNGFIEYRCVSISHDNYFNVLEDVSLIFKEKTHTLLTGASGIGKSTLLKCLVSKENYKGDILISNINIKDYSLNTLRKNIVYVSQNEKLFADSIYNNITCYKKISINKFYMICKLCMIDEIVKNKPFRYMSQIDNELSNLSGGERQRIILARSLLSDANIYIIDEALSEVDYNTEIKIINNIKKSFSNKTIIYVSHKNVNSCFKNIVKLKNKEEYEQRVSFKRAI